MAFMSSFSGRTIDFIEIASNHNDYTETRNNQRSAPLRGTRVLESRLASISLEAKEVTWNPPKIYEESEKPSSVSNRGNTQQSKHSMTETADVTIEQGLCKGLHSSVTVPFPSEDNPSRSFKINPCKPHQTITYKTQVTLRSEPGREFTDFNAVVMKQAYDGQFKCHIYPKGCILKDAQRQGQDSFAQVKIQGIIRDLLRNGQHGSVQDFHPDRDGKYYFILSGKVNLTMDSELQHNYYE